MVFYVMPLSWKPRLETQAKTIRVDLFTILYKCNKLVKMTQFKVHALKQIFKYSELDPKSTCYRWNLFNFGVMMKQFLSLELWTVKALYPIIQIAVDLVRSLGGAFPSKCK